MEISNEWLNYSKNWLFEDFRTSFQTLMDKIYYVRWGNKNDDFYFDRNIVTHYLSKKYNPSKDERTELL